MITLEILITGIVQGVGFRPFVYKIAKKHNIAGYVLNDNRGVFILAQSNKSNIDLFIDSLNNPPKAAKIKQIKKSIINTDEILEDFVIQESDTKEIKTANISPDIAMCADCYKELFDKKNRRYLYPFMSCTNCGARYSIIKSMPYDRSNTSMNIFRMCKECQREYEDVNSRRFHSEINCCSKCGPSLIFTEIFEFNKPDSMLQTSKNNNAIEKASLELKNGKIIALKGIGGYTIICNATNIDSINKLRERKKRPTKPFAIMVKNIEEARKIANINKIEEDTLTSVHAPIVLCQAKNNNLLPTNIIAPNLDTIGIILPYSPIHHILLSKIDFPIIFTSANISGEPIINTFSQLNSKLKDVCDYALTYNRDIENKIDDSLIKVLDDTPQMVRRARGFLNAIDIIDSNNNFIALGAEQKNTFTIQINNKTLLSPHIGDLYNIESIDNLQSTISLFQNQYDAKINTYICDMHPLYSQRKLLKEGMNTHFIQHHFAHLLSNIAENNINSKTLGVIFDGTGYGEDNTIWGGEFLLYDPLNPLYFERIAYFESFYLLGGEAAIKDIRRLGLEGLFLVYGDDIFNTQNKLLDSIKKSFGDNSIQFFYKQHTSGNMPKCNSIGRLFDMITSMCFIIEKSSYEGECGMILETLANSVEINKGDTYEFTIKGKEISILGILNGIVNDSLNNIPINQISLKFHTTIAEIIKEISYKYTDRYDCIAISGGCFQNSILTKMTQEKIKHKKIYINADIPCNDGGISVGQSYYISKIQSSI